MAPRADAVGLIHGQRHKTAIAGMPLEHLSRCLSLQPFRGDVEQAQGGIPQLLLGQLTARRIQAGMQTGRGDTASLQRHHLIFHQGNQRRDHHHQALADQCRQLIAKRFTSAGG